VSVPSAISSTDLENNHKKGNIMEGRFKGRDIISKPMCPFCGMTIEKPKELVTRMPQEMPLGVCECGAVYACDVTGHNLGTAMIEALVFSCNGDWDLAWDLLPEEDYLTGEINDYDYETHLVIHSTAYEGRNISGVLYFVRLHDDVREVTEDGVKRKIEKAKAINNDSGYKKRGKKSFTKKQIEKYVNEYNMGALLELCRQDKRIIPYLQRLLYSADDLLRLRAADALGRVSAVIALKEPGTVSRLLKGLFLSITDTAASSWGAIDAIGAIISNCPEKYSSYTTQLYPLIEDSALRIEVLRAMASIIKSNPTPFIKLKYRLIPLLKDDNPWIRAYTIMILGDLKAGEAKDSLRELSEDLTELRIYNKGNFEKKVIDHLVKAALKKIKSSSAPGGLN
jgi:hypothetical protein